MKLRNLVAGSTLSTLLALAIACSSTPSSTTSSSSGSTGGSDAGLTGCPVLLSGCFAYACTCKNGKSHPQVAGVSPGGACDSAAAACERTCSGEQGVAAVACGSAPVLTDAGPDVVARKQCMAGDFCNYNATGTCKDSTTVRHFDSECPDSGLCPTVAETAAITCAPHGGVDVIDP